MTEKNIETTEVTFRYRTLKVLRDSMGRPLRKQKFKPGKWQYDTKIFSLPAGTPINKYTVKNALPTPKPNYTYEIEIVASGEAKSKIFSDKESHNTTAETINTTIEAKHLGIKNPSDDKSASKLFTEAEKKFNLVITGVNLEKLNEADRKNVIDELVDIFKQRETASNKFIFEQGQILVILKELIPHGEFMRFVRESLGVAAHKCANNYMGAYKISIVNPELRKLKPGLIYLLAKKNCMETMRQFVADNVEMFHDYTQKELALLIDKWRNQEIDETHPLFTEASKAMVEVNQHHNISKKIKPVLTHIQKAVDIVSRLEATNQAERMIEDDYGNSINSDHKSDSDFVYKAVNHILNDAFSVVKRIIDDSKGWIEIEKFRQKEKLEQEEKEIDEMCSAEEKTELQNLLPKLPPCKVVIDKTIVNTDLCPEDHVEDLDAHVEEDGYWKEQRFIESQLCASDLMEDLNAQGEENGYLEEQGFIKENLCNEDLVHKLTDCHLEIQAERDSRKVYEVFEPADCFSQDESLIDRIMQKHEAEAAIEISSPDTFTEHEDEIEDIFAHSEHRRLSQIEDSIVNDYRYNIQEVV